MTKQPRTKIAHAIAGTTLKSGTTKQYSDQIAAYLLSERRTSELNSLMRDVQADWTDAGHVEVTASSAHPLTDGIRETIKQRIQELYPSASRIIVTEAHDPDVIGGVRLSLANQQLDLSIEAKLNRFKQLTTAGKD